MTLFCDIFFCIADLQFCTVCSSRTICRRQPNQKNTKRRYVAVCARGIMICVSLFSEIRVLNIIN